MKSMSSIHKAWAVFAMLALALALVGGPALAGKKGTKDGKTPAKATLVSVPKVEGKPRAEAEAMVRRRGLVPRFQGRGTHVKTQNPRARSRVAEGSEVRLRLATPTKAKPGPTGPKAVEPRSGKVKAPKWVIASVRAEPRAYRLGEPLKLRVQLNDEAKSKKPDKRVTLVIQGEYQDAAGKSHRFSTPPYELASKIRGADRYERVIRLKEAEKADGVNPIRLVLIVKTHGKKTYRKTLEIQPDRLAKGKVARIAKEKLKVRKAPAGLKLPGKDRRGPQVAYLTLGGSLDVDVNGSPPPPGPVVVNPGDTATVNWSVPAGTGILLRVHNAPFGSDPNTYCDPSMFMDFSNPDAGYQAGTVGNHDLDLTDPRYVVGQSYYLMACAWEPGADPEFANFYTNTVEIQYQEAGLVGIPIPPLQGQLFTIPTGTPDLTIEDIFWQNGKVAYRIRNAGDGATGTGLFQVEVRYFPTSFWASGGEITRTFNISPLGANEERVEVTDIYIDKSYLVMVTADSPGNGVIDESDENNNLLIRELDEAKVRLRNLNVHRNNKPDTYITFKTKNKGAATAPNYYVVWRVRDSSNESLVLPTVSGQAPGQERSFTISTEDLPVGDREVRMWVYWGSAENYVSGQNFWLQHWAGIQKDKGYRKIPEGGLPDLKITNLRRDHNNSNAVRIRFRVKNEGAAPISGYTIRYSAGGWSTTVQSQSTLGPGQKSGDFSVGGSSGIQLPPGSHTLYMRLDPEYEIAEENESNNTATKHFSKP